MCGRFLLTTPSDQLPSLFQYEDGPTLFPRYNIAPSQPIATVRAQQDGAGRECVLLRWGLIPSWAKGVRAGQGLLNACAETAAEKPSFRDAFHRRRCLVPADGFYEWQRDGRQRHPFAIRMRSQTEFGNEGLPFAFAGLWERWLAPDGQPLETVVLLTTTANDLVKGIHPRMPVILSAEHYDAWLDPSVSQSDKLRSLLLPYSAEAMTLFPVGNWVNNARHEGPKCLEPRADPGPLLFA